MTERGSKISALNKLTSRVLKIAKSD